MSILDCYRQFNQVPKRFTIDGTNYEYSTMQKSDGVWYAYIWEMDGKRRNLYSHATGDTEEEATQNLVLMNSNPQEV